MRQLDEELIKDHEEKNSEFSKNENKGCDCGKTKLDGSGYCVNCGGETI